MGTRGGATNCTVQTSRSQVLQPYGPRPHSTVIVRTVKLHVV